MVLVLVWGFGWCGGVGEEGSVRWVVAVARVSVRVVGVEDLKGREGRELETLSSRDFFSGAQREGSTGAMQGERAYSCQVSTEKKSMG